jgi:hypothetical protein
VTGTPSLAAPSLDKRLALSIEKRIQMKTRKSTGKTPLLRRIKAFDVILESYKELGFYEL